MKWRQGVQPDRLIDTRASKEFTKMWTLVKQSRDATTTRYKIYVSTSKRKHY